MSQQQGDGPMKGAWFMDAMCAWMKTLKPSERLVFFHLGHPPKDEYDEAVRKEQEQEGKE